MGQANGPSASPGMTEQVPCVTGLDQDQNIIQKTQQTSVPSFVSLQMILNVSVESYMTHEQTVLSLLVGNDAQERHLQDQ